MGRHERCPSFSNIDEVETSGVLADVLKENKVYLGGSSIGKGLTRAARYYLDHRIDSLPIPEHFELPGAQEINEDVDPNPPEEAFYVIDIGVIVSQVYQWRRFFPRVEPFYAVKCNPDPTIVKTLAVLGCNFDCASRAEIRLVQEMSEGLARQPEIIFANPCKAPAHILEAVCKGVTLVTFDNVHEVEKCAKISKNIRLILRIVTDDRGSQCRLSSKFGAPRIRWRPLLAAAKKHGLQVVGVSFHVGSGCRDATRYHLALKDAREIFDMATAEFGFNMEILDIGGGFPGETHSLWNPEELDEQVEENEVIRKEGLGSEVGSDVAVDEEGPSHFMFFNEIAEEVAPVIDELFPPSEGVRVIGEPGRYLVAASATLCTSVIGVRTNQLDESFEPEPIDDKQVAHTLSRMTREEETMLVEGSARHLRKYSLSADNEVEPDSVLGTIVDELAGYSKLFARQNLAQQEADVYNDCIDFFKSDFDVASDILGPPDPEVDNKQTHTVEGMNYPLMIPEESGDTDALITLAAAGEAAVSGICLQAVADSAPLQDDYAIYINDGVYSGFNNIMFDHATVRPRVLRDPDGQVFMAKDNAGFKVLKSSEPDEIDNKNQTLYATSVFGPTCDSIDIVARGVLLPEVKIGDWLYFQNMGAYTMAAASSFNGFAPSEKFYVCSVQPEYFEALIAGPPETEDSNEEKKEG